MACSDTEGRQSFGLCYIRMQSLGTVLQLSVRAKHHLPLSVGGSIVWASSSRGGCSKRGLP
jgi:hypothetical protein